MSNKHPILGRGELYVKDIEIMENYDYNKHDLVLLELTTVAQI